MRATYILLVLMVLAGFSFADEISSCGVEISASGYWNLTQDIETTTNINCINISADNVELDCQDFTINGTGTGMYGIYVNPTIPT